MILPQGINDANFYDLVSYALLQRGYASIADFLRDAPNYWYDEEEWKKLFPMNPYENPTRAFEQKIGDNYVPVMAAYLADDAEKPLVSNQGFEMRTAEIPRMGHGFLYTKKSYEDARRLSRVGVDAVVSKVYDQFSLDTMKLIQGVHAKRTFTALQIESQGYYIATKQNNAGGLDQFKIDMHPLAENKKNAGGYGSKGVKAAYSDTTANPLGDLQDMFEYAYKRNILSEDYTKSIFRMSDSQFDAIKNHASVKKSIALWKTGYMASVDNLANVIVTDEDIARYLVSLKLPAISVSKTYGFREKLDKTTQKIVKEGLSAFADNTIVLRPAGVMGEMQWSKVSNIFATESAPTYYSEGGAIAIQEDTNSRATGKKIDAESLCVPVPTAIERVLYLNTAEAAK